MTWRIEFTERAEKDLRRLDRPVQKRIIALLREVEQLDDTRSRGKGYTGNLAGLWGYRTGPWRIVTDIHDDRLVIVALHVGHRSTVYDD